MTRRVVVGLGARAYDVEIGPGLLDQAGRRIAPLLRRRRTAVVSDETVWALHGERLLAVHHCGLCPISSAAGALRANASSMAGRIVATSACTSMLW